MAYVYLHRRPDKENEVFYVGVGKIEGRNYKRAYVKDKARNKMWLGVVQKNPDYIVEIVVEGLTLDMAFQKEMELIAFYKRKSDGGTLVNITLGGDGIKGVPISEETRKKMSLAKKGKPGPVPKGTKFSEEVRRKMSINGKGRKPWNVGKKHRPESIEKYKKSMEGKHRRGAAHHAFGKPIKPHVLKALLDNRPEKMWNDGRKYTQDELKKYFTKKVRSQQRSITQIENGIELATFHSATIASIVLGLPHSSICKSANGNLAKPCGGFTWRYNQPFIFKKKTNG